MLGWFPKAAPPLLLALAALAVLRGDAEARRPMLNGLIAFGCGGTTPYEEGETCVVTPDGTGFRHLELTEPGGAYWNPQWSPDGSRLAYVSGSNVEPFGIYIYNPSDGTKTFVTDEGQQPVWSPDAREIVFVGRRDDPRLNIHTQLYVINLESGDIRRITPVDESSAEKPSWSTDGSLILFTRYDGFGQNALYTVRPDGSDYELLTEGAVWGEWSPDGREIVANTWIDWEFDVIVLDSGGQLIADLTLNTQGDSEFPTWSPDGDLIAFVHGDVPPGEGLSRGIYTMDVNGGSLEQLTTEGGWLIDWQPVPRQCATDPPHGNSCPWSK